MRVALVLAALSLLLAALFTGLNGAEAKHTQVFVVSMQIEPASPTAGGKAELTIILTNLANEQKTVSLSFALDGKWAIEGVNIQVPAQKSAVATMPITMPPQPGEHSLKACPDRSVYGDDGDQCETMNFTVAEAPKLTVAILSPKDGSVLSGTVEVKVAAMGETAESVDLYIQGEKINQVVDTRAKAPYDFTFDTRKYPDGDYKLYALAHFESGITGISSTKEYTIDNFVEESLTLRVKPGIMLEERATVGQVVEIGTSVTNKEQFKVPATLIVLVKDANGYTEHISWYEERIRTGDTAWISREWIPERSGLYSVEAFLWDTIETANPLSEVMKADVVVS